MHIDKIFIGKKIKEARKQKKLSQAKLAEKINLSDKHIGRIEAGKYIPNFLNFIKIMEVLNIDFDDFGLNLSKVNDKNRKELLEIIYSANEKEINLYLKLIKTLRENI